MRVSAISIVFDVGPIVAPLLGAMLLLVALWTPRWQFFAPWSPFAALLGVMQVAFALEERNPR